MSPCHDTPQGYAKDIEANRADLRGPTDGTVCYTNGGQEAARAYVARERAEGRDATTLEQTKYGAKLDKEELWRNTPENRAFNNAERDRQKQAGVRNVDPRQAGTKEVWGKASQTFAEEAHGKVTVVTNDKPIDEKGFFAKHEREALIRNKNVTQINGVKREVLEKKLDAFEIAQAKAVVATTASQKAEAKEAQDKALLDLNGTIVKGDPTRTKSMDTIKRDAKYRDADHTARHKARHGHFDTPRKPATQKTIHKQK